MGVLIVGYTVMGYGSFACKDRYFPCNRKGKRGINVVLLSYDIRLYTLRGCLNLLSDSPLAIMYKPMCVT